MTLLRLAWRLLVARPTTPVLSLLLLTVGWAAVAFVLLVSEQLDARVRKDLAGIDLVVGAKGSPMQILMAGVFHADVPTGNIPLATVDALRQHPLVAEAIPLSVGDSVRGWRLVGSEPSYLRLYDARVAEGREVGAPLEIVLGQDVALATGLRVGDRVAGSHGLAGDGASHADHPFTVVGILARSGSVLDRLVLTSLASVWQVHEVHGTPAPAPVDPKARAQPERERGQGSTGHDDHDHDHDHDQSEPSAPHAADAAGAPSTDADREVTLALVRYRSPLAAALLPRWVNAQEGLQSASPALESARLLRMVGAGREVLQGFGALLLLSSLLSLFMTQWHLVRERQADLALLRLMGAPPHRLAALVALQAVAVVTVALGLGLGLAHAAQAVLAHWLADRQSLALAPDFVTSTEWLLFPVAWGLALLAALGPAWRALRTEVSPLLQAPR